MRALAYRNTKTTLPGWVPTVHIDQPQGVAYETDTHFVHFYARGSGLYVLSIGLTATEEKNASLADWTSRAFGAQDVVECRNAVGTTVKGVWRPGIYLQTEALQALGNSDSDQRAAEQSLRLLVDRLDELLLYIEPDTHGLNSYSHKTRELLILACTEVESTWKLYMRSAGAAPLNGKDFTTKDYVKLLEPLYLREYEVLVKPYPSVSSLKPFADWDPAAPSRSLTWYDAYNKTKHDRANYFCEGTLRNCFMAVAANLVLFAVRFSPFPLLEGVGVLPPLINQLFNIRLSGFSQNAWYVPMLKLPTDMRSDLICGNRGDLVQPWVVEELRLP